MKFGGSSVADSGRIRHVASIIGGSVSRRPVVVLSAMGDTTDHLLEAAERAVSGTVDISQIQELHEKTAAELGTGAENITALFAELKTLLTGISMLRELTKRTRDYLVSFGERLSVRIMAGYLCSAGIPAQFFDAWDIGFVSDSNFMAADLLDETWDNIRKNLGPYDAGETDAVPIVTGFIAKDTHGYITTLGRGGSDLTATVIGAAMRAEEIQTWKDVDGIMTADPRIVASARSVPVVTYDEAAELAYFGAQVLHPRSMRPCLLTGTPVRVKNSYNPASPGTIIVELHTDTPVPVRAVTSKNNVTLIDIVSTRMLGQSGFLQHIFAQFMKWDVSIDVIATSEVSVSLTVNTDRDLSGLKTDLEKVADINIKKGKAIVTVICDVTKSSRILAVTFAALEQAGINVQMISQGASKVNISMICDDSEAPRVVRALHGVYFGEKEGEGLC